LKEKKGHLKIDNLQLWRNFDPGGNPMKQTRKKLTLAVLIMMVLAFFLAVSGCTGLETKSSDPSSSASAKKDEGPVPLYYDFGDVLVPSELKINKENSFVFQTPGLSAGVLSLKGRVESGSLIAFFENNMAKDAWKKVSSFKSPRTILMFQKENRWCVINITDGDFTTSVEIWVAPTMSESDTGLMK
jgi:hypothetical protein